MSTYTDLHNRIKENLTILRRPSSLDDGMTPQRVIFINPENQFYGTFNGIMNVSGGTLSDLSFKGGTIDGTTIKDATFLDGSTPVQIGELAAASQEHEEKISSLEEQVDDLSAKQGTISASVDLLRGDLTDTIKKEIESLQSFSSEALSAISDDVKALSNELSSISALSLEIEKLSATNLDHVVFHGDMVLTQTKYDRVGDLFQKVFCRCFGAATPVANGTLYRIVFDYDKIPKTQKKVIVTDEPGSAKHIELGNGDYILVKNHDKSKKHVDPMTMVGDDISIVVQDLDFVRSDELCCVSSLLSSNDKSIIDSIREVSASAIASAVSSANQYTDVQIKEVYLCAVISSLDDSAILCRKLCAELSNALTGEINSKYVHLSGDHVAWVDSDRISASNFHAKSLVVDSSDLASIRTKDRIVLSGDALSVQTNHGFEDVTVNGRSLASAFDEKLDISMASAISSQLALSNDVDKKLSDFNNQLSIYYDSHERKIWVGGCNYGLATSIDAGQFVKDGILSTVGLSTINGSPTLVFVWNTDAKKTTSYVNVSSLVDVYQVSGDGIKSDGHTFYLDFDKVTHVNALNATKKDLLGLSGENASHHKYLSNQIDNISVDSLRKLVFDGHLKYSQICAYTTVDDFFTDSGYFQESELPNVENGAVFDIEFDPQIKSSCISVESIRICDGDVLVVHDHRNTRYVDISSLTFKDDNPSKKNAYLFKVGVSRYDLDTQISNKSEEIAAISAWLNSKFEYPDGDSLSVKTNVFFERGATVSSSLSVGEDTTVAKSLLVGERIKSLNVDANGISSNYLSSNEISAGKLTASFKEIHDSDSPSETLQDVHNQLSTKIDKKIFAGDYNEERISNLSTDSLSILRIGHDKFAEKIFNGNTSLYDKILYVVSSDNLDFYGEKGVNLADPEQLSDATNKKYVDTSIDKSIAGVNTDIKAISDDILVKIIKINGDLGKAISSKIYIEDRVSEDGKPSYSDLSVIKLSAKDYYNLVHLGKTDVSTLYVVESDFINAYGQQIRNLCAPTLLSDATNKEYVDDISSQLCSCISGFSKMLSSFDGRLSSEISTKIFIGTKTSSYVDASGYIHLCSVSGNYSNLSVLKVQESDYHKLVADGQVDQSVLYVVETSAINAYGSRIVNLDDPISSDDAASKKYVDSFVDTKMHEHSAGIDPKLSYLSSAISSKVLVQHLTTNKPTSAYVDLSVIKISENDYQGLVNNEGTLLSDAVYIVENDVFINAYDQQIKNLSGPTDDTDAATKEYVDSRVDGKSNTELLSVTLESGTLSSSRQKLDMFTIDKFDSLDAYKRYIELPNKSISPTDLVVIDRDQLDADGRKVINVERPTLPSDAANKAYVDEKNNLISSNQFLSGFFERVEAGGPSSVTLDDAVSAVFQLVKILRGSAD